MQHPKKEGISKDNSRCLQRTYNSEQVIELLALSKFRLDKLCHLNQIPYHVYEGQRKRYFLEDDLIAFQQSLIRRRTKDEVTQSKLDKGS
jgi:DNA-binding transcriptional regulator GbsR (MarR family)